MAGDEAKGFVIRDRRGRAEEDRPQPAGGSAKPASAESVGEARGPSSREQPPVTFASFIFSLGTSALMLLGERLDPRAEVQVNLEQAKEIIDILSMLEAKTQGNLTSEEKTVLDNTLYALRMKYVDLASKPRTAG